jgi:hypothetical protein
MAASLIRAETSLGLDASEASADELPCSVADGGVEPE